MFLLTGGPGSIGRSRAHGLVGGAGRPGAAEEVAMAALLREIRFALRALRRSPGFTLATLATLTLGIGVNTTIFTLIDGVLLRGLPGIADDGRLASLYGSEGEDSRLGVDSYADFRDLRERCRSFAGLAAYKHLAMDLAAGGTTERVTGALVTSDYFAVLGVRPALGRFFLPAEDRDPGAPAVAVLGHALWRERFGSDPAAIGATVTLNGRAFEVVGVAPEGFAGTSRTERPLLFVPMTMQPHFMPTSGNLLAARGWSGVLVVGRLAAGVSLAAARSEVEAVAAALRQEYPDTNSERRYQLEPFARSGLMPDVAAQATAGGMLLVGVGLAVLVVACLNLSNFTLARGLGRRREIAVRRALGAGRGRVMGHFLTESLLLALAGGGLSLLAAMWSTDLVASLLTAVHADLGLDLRVFAFTLAVSVAAAGLFSLGPALHLTHPRALAALREGAAARGRAGGRRLSRGLVVAQVALSLLLLVVAGLLGRTWVGLRTSDLGFDPQNVLIAGLDPALQSYRPAEIGQFYGQLLERLAALPGVTGVSCTSALPWSGVDTSSFTLEGEARPPGQPLYTQVDAVGPSYFETLRLPLVAGRSFAPADQGSRSLVVVINRAAQEWFEQLTGRAALGTRISFEGSAGPWAEIVGVVGDAVTSSLRERPAPTVYLPAGQAPRSGLGSSSLVLLVRTQGEPLAALPAVREAVRELDPDLPLVGATTLEGHLAEVLAPEKLALALTGASALLVLALAAVGLYGLLAQAVGRRRGELGVRLALGARGRDLERMVVGEGMALVGAGALLGLAGALAAGRLLRGFLYRVSPSDPLTLAATTGVLAAVALVACYLPARRAGRVDPLESIRAE
jgi:putative ABC transport system permease protein